MSDQARTVRAHAPGRVNLIGEHTDYNDGFVLPTAIPQETQVILTTRDDDFVRVKSDAGAPASYRLGREERQHAWVDYVAGVTQALAARGHRLRGFEADITSNIPIGAGLSSSAALEVSLLRALRDAFALTLDDVTLARIGQAAENDFVGAPVGVMDQMASSLAQPGFCLFIDTRSLEHQRIALPDAAELVVIDSRAPHDHASGEYRVRRAQCESAAKALGVRALRDATPDDLERGAGRLSALERRRARHVVTENQRVLSTVTALRRGDLAQVGQLFYQSHASMRDDFEVSIPEIDSLVELAGREPEVYGARLTGGGFGGSIVALVRRGSGERVAANVVAGYRREQSREAAVLVPLPSLTRQR